MANECVRILADVNQIRRCAARIAENESLIERQARYFGLVGNKVRLQILILLSDEGRLCPCDLSDILGLSISAVSQHLRKLRDGGMVRNAKEGQLIYYSLSSESQALLETMPGNLPLRQGPELRDVVV